MSSVTRVAGIGLADRLTALIVNVVGEPPACSDVGNDALSAGLSFRVAPW